MDDFREDPGSLATYEYEAFEQWAAENLPGLDWEDEDAVETAYAGPWKAFVDEIERKAQAEIDDSEERLEALLRERMEVEE